jgi:hypothetical protein
MDGKFGAEVTALYGSSTLSGFEHLTLFVGNEEIASALIRRFGSIKALSRASLQQIRQFLPRRKAEILVVAFSVSEILDNPEAVYRACTDMKPSIKSGDPDLKTNSVIEFRRILCGGE